MDLAQLNVGRLLDDPDSRAVAEFMNALLAITFSVSRAPVSCGD